MVGDRYLTDIVFGNMTGMLTIYTYPLSNVEPYSTSLVNFTFNIIINSFFRQGNLKIG